MKKLTPLEQIAFNIACEAPIKPSDTYSARVPWHDIIAMRDELTRLGWDWKHYAELYREQRSRARNGAGK